MESFGIFFADGSRIEQDRLDLAHHAWKIQLGGDLLKAPIPEAQLKKALDLGTGTGIWAIDFVGPPFNSREREILIYLSGRRTSQLPGHRHRPQPHPSPLGTPQRQVRNRRLFPSLPITPPNPVRTTKKPGSETATTTSSTSAT